MTLNPLNTTVFNLLLQSAGAAPIGVQLSWPSLSNARDRIIALDFTLDTNAVAANRYLGIQMIDGVGTILVASSPFIQPANTVFRYLVSVGAEFNHETNIDYVTLPLPPDIFVTSTVFLQTTVLNWNAGDRYLTNNYLYARQANPR